MSRVVIVGASPESLVNFRGDLIRAMVRAGHDVTAMSAPASADEVSRIEALGAHFRSFKVQRNGLNPGSDLHTLWQLHTAFREIKPDVVLAYTIKPVIWGGIALFNFPAVRFYALITGLGVALHGQTILRKSLTALVSLLYRGALAKATRVMFQNKDDQHTFVSRNLTPDEKTARVFGSGVNLAHFARVEFPQAGTVFLLIARLLGDKGVREYERAACLVKQRYPNVIFRLLGSQDSSPNGVPSRELNEWRARGAVELLGTTLDVRPVIAACHVFVLPSYHEGMPRSVLEAMAIGRPILTTDVAGCRETVIDASNGYLVPKADAEALAERMIWFVENKNEWPRMGMTSRKMAEEYFDVHKVNAQMLGIMKLSAEV